MTAYSSSERLTSLNYESLQCNLIHACVYENEPNGRIRDG